jgi:hypothetical protein
MVLAELLRKAIKVVFDGGAFTLWKKLWLNMVDQSFRRHHEFRRDGNFVDISEWPVIVRAHAVPA